MGNDADGLDNGSTLGHRKLPDGQPSKSIHTILNCDPEARLLFNIDALANNPGHSTVPAGQLVLSAPGAPRDPDGPCDPELACKLQLSIFILDPLVPADGVS